MREVRREYAARALELNGGNYTATAKMLGVAINSLKAYLAGE
jgi:transposase